MLEFSDTLEILLTESNSWQPLRKAKELVRKLSVAKQIISDLQHQLLSAKSKINAELTLMIRRKMPAMNVGLDRYGYCKVGYKTKTLSLSPDIESDIWHIRSSDSRFLNGFLKSKRSNLIIGDNVEQLADAVITYFTDYYKSLGEDINGNGLILVDGKIGTLRDIVEWKEEKLHIAPLNSRSKRQKCLANA